MNSLLILLEIASIGTLGASAATPERSGCMAWARELSNRRSRYCHSAGTVAWLCWNETDGRGQPHSLDERSSTAGERTTGRKRYETKTAKGSGR